MSALEASCGCHDPTHFPAREAERSGEPKLRIQVVSTEISNSMAKQPEGLELHCLTLALIADADNSASLIRRKHAAVH